MVTMVTSTQTGSGETSTLMLASRHPPALNHLLQYVSLSYLSVNISGSTLNYSSFISILFGEELNLAVWRSDLPSQLPKLKFPFLLA